MVLPINPSTDHSSPASTCWLNAPIIQKSDVVHAHRPTKGERVDEVDAAHILPEGLPSTEPNKERRQPHCSINLHFTFLFSFSYCSHFPFLIFSPFVPWATYIRVHYTIPTRRIREIVPWSPLTTVGSVSPWRIRSIRNKSASCHSESSEAFWHSCLPILRPRPIECCPLTLFWRVQIPFAIVINLAMLGNLIFDVSEGNSNSASCRDAEGKFYCGRLLDDSKMREARECLQNCGRTCCPKYYVHVILWIATFWSPWQRWHITESHILLTSRGASRMCENNGMRQ